jgi:hypothetical protein
MMSRGTSPRAQDHPGFAAAILVGWVERINRTLVRSIRETHRHVVDLTGFAKRSTRPPFFASFAFVVEAKDAASQALATTSRDPRVNRVR